ncbi:hypothetical protein BegalDRAFT_0201 [Beggiatoa alba B18LD]|uniref:Oxygen tolerance n=1 Tax=Beggiatoa alba B18LD TaxID=395493 RepID=I3CBY1_9GAMM|nr:BatD family protein [Beggiatoa alba]EIJ41124.1 hypothetical protein BegalDRAFT_0201 [Beggiatoa alba B18LD]
MKHLIYNYLFISLLSWTGASYAAAQLNAVVEPHSNRLTLGQTFRVRITLINASETDIRSNNTPNLEGLHTAFSIKNQQRILPPAINVNGEMRRQIIWQYTLEPHRAGTVTLPAFSLNTSVGVLYSQTLELTILDDRQPIKTAFILETQISNPNPYLYEPIYYTLRLYYQGELRDLQPIPPTDGIIMEHLGNPMGKVIKNQRGVLNNQEVIIGEVVYLLTPLRTGTLNLPASKMKGLQPEEQQTLISQQTNFSTINYQPIEITSRPVVLNVQAPPEPLQNNWLPAKSLSLTRTWQQDLTQAIPVGVPLVCTLLLTVEGVGGQPLPQLVDLLTQTTDFRIHHPSPATQRKVSTEDGKTPINTIRQEISITPLKTGVLTLPPLKIQWWDTVNKRLQLTELPNESITVIPLQTAEAIQTTIDTAEVEKRYFLKNYQVITIILPIILFSVLLWFSPSLARAIHRYKKKRSLHYQWQHIETMAQLQQVIQNNIQETWGIATPVHFAQLQQYLAQHYENSELLLGTYYFIERELYKPHDSLETEADKKDIIMLCEQWQKGLKGLKDKPKMLHHSQLHALNPPV